MKNLTNQLNAIKIILLLQKLYSNLYSDFKSKKVEFDFKNKLNKIKFPTNSVKLLGNKINKQLNRIDYVNEVTIKPNRANAMLHKVSEFVSTNRSNLLCYM